MYCILSFCKFLLISVFCFIQCGYNRLFFVSADAVMFNRIFGLFFVLLSTNIVPSEKWIFKRPTYTHIQCKNMRIYLTLMMWMLRLNLNANNPQCFYFNYCTAHGWEALDMGSTFKFWHATPLSERAKLVFKHLVNVSRDGCKLPC